MNHMKIYSKSTWLFNGLMIQYNQKNGRSPTTAKMNYNIKLFGGTDYEIQRIYRQEERNRIC